MKTAKSVNATSNASIVPKGKSGVATNEPPSELLLVGEGEPVELGGPVVPIELVVANGVADV